MAWVLLFLETHYRPGLADFFYRVPNGGSGSPEKIGLVAGRHR
jgi:hypothetical protein